jgi:hypothetical protein
MTYKLYGRAISLVSSVACELMILSHSVKCRCLLLCFVILLLEFYVAMSCESDLISYHACYIQ